jgi:hypothetical protein
MISANEIKLRPEFLKLQLAGLKKRYARQLKREAFIKKHAKVILSLDMKGWPKTKEMRDYLKWLDIIYQAKIQGIYGIGTSNCDVIAQLNRYVKNYKTQK